MAAEAEDYMRMIKDANIGKGLLGFGGGTGVSYASAPMGAQTYSANSLVTR